MILPESVDVSVAAAGAAGDTSGAPDASNSGDVSREQNVCPEDLSRFEPDTGNSEYVRK